MKKIVEKLMEHGMSFEYEHRGLLGEKIISHELGLEISNQNGKIYYSLSAPTEILEESEKMYSFLVVKIEEECVAETSSF